MRVLIYGGGNVGLGIASCLLKSGEKVDIIAREHTVFDLRKDGLLRTGIFGKYYADPKAFNSYSLLKSLPQNVYDYILVCVKSFDSEFTAKDISKYPCLLNSKSKIVLCQNGWGNAEIFASFFPKDKVYNARVITGFRKLHKNHVDITVHADDIHIGSLYNDNVSNVENLCLSITKGGVPCNTTKNIGKDLWAKMLYNCALNPLGAILGVPYGDLGERSYSRTIMKEIVNEIFNVLKKTSYGTYWQCAECYLEDFYGKFLPPTARHESSMLQDICAQKKTEIDALNGAVIHLGEKLKVATPYNIIVYNMIKFIENKNGKESSCLNSLNKDYPMNNTKDLSTIELKVA